METSLIATHDVVTRNMYIVIKSILLNIIYISSYIFEVVGNITIVI